MQAVLADEWKQPKSEAVIIQSKHGHASDPQFRSAVSDLIGHLRQMPQIAKVQSPYAPGYDGMQSKDGRTVMVSMLIRHGYGVLVFDRRGEGASDGASNLLGWGGDEDILAAVKFLQKRHDVRPSRIGGLGLSVGGELMLVRRGG